ncbi:MAG TPA: muconolactone Delta-isomerase family protein [Ignavibacteriaceae bacterium]|nr:muconolactone Delta-isomerase family protein [Ignavibacteriaceae bacterium]
MENLIMYDFMVEIQLPSAMTEDFVSKIPHQRIAVDRLVQLGKIRSYSLSLERRKLWLIATCESEIQVEDLLSQFPIYDYISYEIFKLNFHNTSAIGFPQFSLN